MRELLPGAALQEEHVVVVGDAEQLAHQRDGLVVDGLVLLAAVAVLHDATSPTRAKSSELALGALEGGQREGPRGRR